MTILQQLIQRAQAAPGRIVLDGEVQLDAAVIPSIAARKVKDAGLGAACQ